MYKNRVVEARNLFCGEQLTVRRARATALHECLHAWHVDCEMEALEEELRNFSRKGHIGLWFVRRSREGQESKAGTFSLNASCLRQEDVLHKSGSYLGYGQKYHPKRRPGSALS